MSPPPKRRNVAKKKAAPTPPDPRTGAPLKSVDRRREFEHASRLTPRDPAAERAFIEGKIDMIRTDPRLSDEEKDRAISKLRNRRSQQP